MSICFLCCKGDAALETPHPARDNLTRRRRFGCETGKAAGATAYTSFSVLSFIRRGRLGLGRFQPGAIASPASAGLTAPSQPNFT